MSTFECPKCGKEHDIGNYPDHLTDMRNNRFTFECECGAEFECTVDWEPQIWPSNETVRMKEPHR